jgi:hypothetical protein
VLALAGVLMVLDGHIGFTTFWVMAAIVLYVLVGLFGALLFAPSLRRQTDLAAAGTDAAAYGAAARRTTMTGLLTMVPVAVILYLMVMKPTPERYGSRHLRSLTETPAAYWMVGCTRLRRRRSPTGLVPKA